MNIKLKSRRCLAGVLSTVLLSTTLTGCGGTSILTEDVTKYNLPAELTIQEVQEYYKQSMAFDSVVTRNIQVHETSYEMHPVEPGDTAYKPIVDLTSKALTMLEQMEYPYSEENARALTESGYHYMKAWLNDKHLTDIEEFTMSEALGFYFVDIPVTVGPRSYGSFTGASSLLGINGAFKRDIITGEDSIDEDYIRSSIKTMNEYFVANRIPKMATYNPATHRLSTSVDVTNDTSIDFTDTTASDQSGYEAVPNSNTPLTNDGMTTDDATNGDADAVDNGVKGEESYEPSDGFTTDSTIKDTDKDDFQINSPGIDISQWHEIVGSSMERTAYMPDVSLVYNMPEQETVPNSTFCIGGTGMYPAGKGGLKVFQWDRDNMSGTAVIRLVFKEDVQRPGDYINTNIYPKSMDITTGISFNGDNSMANFLIERFNQLIERADRSIANCDMTALMNGKIFADMGMAVLRGYENDHVNLIRQISTVRRIVKRDIPSNTYLLEVETLRQEGAKGYNTVGTYLDTAYVAVQQQGLEFVITDWLTYSRVMQKEPDIDPDSAILKRLVALDIAGEVPDSTKKSAQQLLNDLYSASTYRVLSVSKDFMQVDTANGPIYLVKGMTDCFNPNPEMLSSSDNASINSGLRSKLIKYGTNVSAQMRGQVFEWIGGTEKQAEFMTEELITYTGRSDGIYMKCYYLVSNLEDNWVIDDIQIIDTQVVEGTELQTLADRIPNIVTYSSEEELAQSRIIIKTIKNDDNTSGTDADTDEGTQDSSNSDNQAD